MTFRILFHSVILKTFLQCQVAKSIISPAKRERPLLAIDLKKGVAQANILLAIFSHKIQTYKLRAHLTTI